MIGSNRFRTILCIIFSLCILAPAISKAVSLSVESTIARPGNNIHIQITVDQPSEIAATIFALNYNTEYFALTAVESSFFDTFSSQWQSLTPAPEPFPKTSTLVEGITYTSPVVYKVSTGKVLIAGARIMAGQTATTLFNLSFTVANNVPNGTYPISIEAATMNNINCGYSASGETLPILIGAIEGETNLSQAFPPLTVSLESGAIIVQATLTDMDQDGIDDNWELFMFGDLDTANETSDWDNDGYTDLQEYLNQLANETDPQGNVYHPKKVNAPGGTYKTESGNILLLIIPALMHSVNQ